jgi:Holliday junction resolvasome RuvABC endonuclease subunit
MPKKKFKILAINPGTREIGFALIGFALLEGGELIYYGVRIIRSRKSFRETLREGRRIILRLINDLRPNVLAIEKPFAKSCGFALLNTFVDEVRAISRRKSLKLLNLTQGAVKKQICGCGHASKKEVARLVAAKYPELRVYLTQDRAWKERYHQSMFDAVALGIVAESHRF